jgi:hypothetical protein
VNLNLILAVVWVVVGVAWVVWDAASGGPDPNWRGPFGLSPGWVMFLLAGYNVVRWLLRPRRGPRRDELHEALEARRRPRGERPEPPGPPDPNFVFTDEPPPPTPPA